MMIIQMFTSDTVVVRPITLGPLAAILVVAVAYTHDTGQVKPQARVSCPQQDIIIVKIRGRRRIDTLHRQTRVQKYTSRSRKWRLLLIKLTSEFHFAFLFCESGK